jgi:surface polysaccharide O-acyltransferase-like enzyme
MRLASVSQGRNNNFNLFRIVAALAVVVTHSFVLSSGNPGDEPLRQTLGTTLGSIAVDVFFVTSGLLIAASLLRSQCLVAFARARCLRISPGLIVMTEIGSGALGDAMNAILCRAGHSLRMILAHLRMLYFALVSQLALLPLINPPLPRSSRPLALS